jgi:hypothetical protein
MYKKDSDSAFENDSYTRAACTMLKSQIAAFAPNELPVASRCSVTTTEGRGAGRARARKELKGLK